MTDHLYLVAPATIDADVLRPVVEAVIARTDLSGSVFLEPEGGDALWVSTPDGSIALEPAIWRARPGLRASHPDIIPARLDDGRAVPAIRTVPPPGLWANWMCARLYHGVGVALGGFLAREELVFPSDPNSYPTFATWLAAVESVAGLAALRARYGTTERRRRGSAIHIREPCP
jgi:hypothetical protein